MLHFEIFRKVIFILTEPYMSITCHEGSIILIALGYYVSRTLQRDDPPIKPNFWYEYLSTTTNEKYWDVYIYICNSNSSNSNMYIVTVVWRKLKWLIIYSKKTCWLRKFLTRILHYYKRSHSIRHLATIS